MALAQALPTSFSNALAEVGIPQSAVSVYIASAQQDATPLVAHRAQVPMNPASVMKLTTAYAALDILGPAYTWKTPVFTDAPVVGGVLQGNLYIQGQGNPKLVIENAWLLARRIAGLGIREIAGNVVLDQSAFRLANASANDFDGEGLRPYNVLPQALLLNFNSMVFQFSPSKGGDTAMVSMTPTLSGVGFTQQVALNDRPCTDWKSSLALDYRNPTFIRFQGSYPRSCGVQAWPIAYSQPKRYGALFIEALLKSVGITVKGSIQTGLVPPEVAAQEPLAVDESASLTQILLDVNKFSNNVMARHVFLTLGLQKRKDGSLEASREVFNAWWRERLPQVPPPIIDNGSGLSLEERISAAALGRMLAHAYQSPLMPEFLVSLPIVGIDGTLRRSNAVNKGRAHIKTGTMPRSGVSAIAGVVHSLSGQRLVLVAIINHPRAAQAKPAMDALIDAAMELE